jgi:hypothetical protein
MTVFYSLRRNIKLDAEWLVPLFPESLWVSTVLELQADPIRETESYNV